MKNNKLIFILGFALLATSCSSNYYPLFGVPVNENDAQYVDDTYRKIDFEKVTEIFAENQKKVIQYETIEYEYQLNKYKIENNTKIGILGTAEDYFFKGIGYEKSDFPVTDRTSEVSSGYYTIEKLNAFIENSKDYNIYTLNNNILIKLKKDIVPSETDYDVISTYFVGESEITMVINEYNYLVYSSQSFD